MAQGADGKPAAEIGYLVPDRFVHGYGLSPSVVELAATMSPDLIVTVDNGIASVEGVARAHELGIAVLVTDHHLPGEDAARRRVHRQSEPARLRFRVEVHRRRRRHVLRDAGAPGRSCAERGWFAPENGRARVNLATLLDLVALGTVADVVKLDRNNRILVSRGLKRMRGGKLTPGIAALFAPPADEPARRRPSTSASCSARGSMPPDDSPTCRSASSASPPTTGTARSTSRSSSTR